MTGTLQYKERTRVTVSASSGGPHEFISMENARALSSSLGSTSVHAAPSGVLSGASVLKVYEVRGSDTVPLQPLETRGTKADHGSIREAEP